MEQNSESNIIERARQGDQEAISRLYEETKNYAFFVARRYLQNDEDIADVLQEAYISVFSKLDAFEDGKPFKPWLHAIVTNKCLNFIKSRRAVFVSVDEIGELAGDNEELIPASWLERAEKRRDILRIIDGLPEGQRMAVTLFYFEGLFISDMAEIMGVAEGTVKAHLYFGRKTIKEAVLREEEKGNKLYAIVPLPLLTQLFELEAETAVMPESMSQKVWEGTLQELASNGVVTGSAAANAPATALGAAKAGMTLATKIIIGVVAAAVVTAGAVFLPPLFNSTDDSNPPGVTGTVTPDGSQNADQPGNGGDNGDTSAPNDNGSAGDDMPRVPSNLTGEAQFSSDDLDAWGFPRGMDLYELRDRGFTMEIPGSIPSIEDYLADLQTNPEWYPSGGMTFYENPTIWVRSDDLLIDDIYIYENDTALGPRGLAIGMTPEQVLDLFYCDNREVYEYIKNPSPGMLPPVPSGYYSQSFYLYQEWPASGTIRIMENGQVDQIEYVISQHSAVTVSFTDNRVSTIRVQYIYMDN